MRDIFGRKFNACHTDNSSQIARRVWVAVCCPCANFCILYMYCTVAAMKSAIEYGINRRKGLAYNHSTLGDFIPVVYLRSKETGHLLFRIHIFSSALICFIADAKVQYNMYCKVGNKGLWLLYLYCTDAVV